MLNPFPIQFLALFAYFLLRITVSLVLFVIVKKQLRLRHETPTPKFLNILLVLEIAIMGALLIGVYTQYAALGLMLLSGMVFFTERVSKHSLQYCIPGTTAVLLFGIGVSLFITGAGVFAVDLPI